MNEQDAAARRELLLKFKKPFEMTLPSGLVVLLRRPPLAKWIAAGEIPESFFAAASAALAAANGGEPKQSEGTADVTMEEAMSLGLKIAEAAFVWPKLVKGAAEDSPDEMDPETLHMADVFVITNWALRGSPGLPVPAAGGGLSVEALRSFRSDENVPGDSGDGGEVRPEAVSAVGD